MHSFGPKKFRSIKHTKKAGGAVIFSAYPPIRNGVADRRIGDRCEAADGRIGDRREAADRQIFGGKKILPRGTLEP